MPPASRTSPMRKSTLPRRHWTCSEEIELATTWLAWLATATAGGKAATNTTRGAPERRRRGQEAAADAEHAGQQAGRAAQREQDEHVHRLFGDRQIDLHAPRLTSA